MDPTASASNTAPAADGSSATQNDSPAWTIRRCVAYADTPNTAGWNIESWPVKPKITSKVTAKMPQMNVKKKLESRKSLRTKIGSAASTTNEPAPSLIRF